MATKTIRLKLIRNLAVNDIVSYSIWKSNGNRIMYNNTISNVSMRASNAAGAPYNFPLGNSITETMQNLTKALDVFNYHYTGLTYTFDGVDELRIDITNADGFEHIINTISVPNNKMLVLTAKECSTVYLYNNSLLNQFNGPLVMTKDGASFFNDNHPKKFDAEVNRNASYAANINGTPIQFDIPNALDDSQVSHQLLTDLRALISITPFTYFNYANYFFIFAQENNTNYDRTITDLAPDATNDINILDRWGCNTFYQIKTGPVSIGFSLIPQKLTPVYNPVIYKFGLPNYSEPGFRYFLNVVNELNSQDIVNFTIIPDIDGSGYVDLSKHLSNLTTYDFTQQDSNNDCPNSYVKYGLNLGYELNETWSYTNFATQTISGITYVRLIQADNVTIPNFSIGDDVSISTGTGIAQNINGLHKVVAVNTTGYSITIDVVASVSGGTIGGTVRFADNRKTRYTNIASVSNQFAWNGALTWRPYKELQYTDYFIEVDSGDPDVNLLTSIQPYTNGYEIYATPQQDYWFNFMIDQVDKELSLKIISSSGDSFFKDINGTLPNGYMKQFKLNIEELILDEGFDSNMKWIEISVVDPSNGYDRVTNEYRFYIDNRCQIEPYQILFMDRLGSFQSFAFQLRSYEKGTIKRDEYNKQIDWFGNYDPNGSRQTSNQTFNLTDAGKTIWNVEITKELSLNTNWMNDEMSVLFEELLTSPATFIKIDGFYYACIVKETSFETTRQKNKTLIKKDITVKYSNDNPINI